MHGAGRVKKLYDKGPWKWDIDLTWVNPLTTNVPHCIETSQLIFIASQLTGFYMMGNIGRSWVKRLFTEQKE